MTTTTLMRTTTTNPYHGHPSRWLLCLPVAVMMTNIGEVDSFSFGPSMTKLPTISSSPTTMARCPFKLVSSSSLSLSTSSSNQQVHDKNNSLQATVKTNPWTLTTTTWMVSMMLMIATTTTSPMMALADYDSMMDNSDVTVQTTLTKLKEAQGNPQASFSVFEDVAAMITEGKGIGGAINYQGVKLDRGYVADEDTSIYNPGLTLLTEGEKERLVQAILESRRVGLQQNQWPENNQVAFDFLKGSLDPYHLSELRGYLNILPFYIGIWYLGTMAVQQVARQWFAAAYLVAVAAILVPGIVWVAFGPQ